MQAAAYVAVEIGSEDGARGVDADAVFVGQGGAGQFAVERHHIDRDGAGFADGHDNEQDVRLMFGGFLHGFRPVVIKSSVLFGFAVGQRRRHEGEGAEQAVYVEVEDAVFVGDTFAFIGADAPFVLQGVQEAGGVKAVFFQEDEALGVAHGEPFGSE